MAFLVIFTFAGVLLGSLVFSGNGWLIGGALGFLLTKMVQLSQQVRWLEREVRALREHGVPVDVKSNRELEKDVGPVEQEQMPLAERLSTYDVRLPDEDTKVGVENAGQDKPPAEPLIQTPNQPGSKPSLQTPSGPTSRAREPNFVENIPNYVRDFFTQGNPIVRIGMIVMFFGLSFLVKYAANQGFLPLEVRMALVAAVAMALIGLGWKNRFRVGGYGLVLQGGGIAALYLTIFAAGKMYPLMPSGLAFGLMFVVVVLGAALAIIQNAQVLAVMASAGGFLAPVLTSDGSGSHVGLFGFYLLLNLGILTIAWFRSWRMLNWIGFVFTFVIASAWGVLKYEPHLYSSTQPFLAIFFVLYLLVSILFSLKQPTNLKGFVDGSLVFGLPIVAFGLQAALLKHTDYGLALSALALAAVYTLVARLLWARYRRTHRLLTESFLALGVCFATLSIPLALDAQWTSAAWALEAAGLVWVGLRQQRLLPRVAGYALHFAAAISLLVHGIRSGATPILDGDFLGLLMLFVTATGIAYLLYRHKEKAHAIELKIKTLGLHLGYFWWLWACHLEITTHLEGRAHFPSFVAVLALSTLLNLWVGMKIRWPALTALAYWLLPLTVLWTVRAAGEALAIGYSVYPSQGWNWLALALFVIVQYRFLWHYSKNETLGLTDDFSKRASSQTARSRTGSLQGVYHVLTAWFLFSLCCWEATHWQQYFQWYGTSGNILWFVCIAIPLIFLLRFANKPFWPFSFHIQDYKNLIPAPLLLLIVCWFLNASRYPGSTEHLYLPILNPMDLSQAAVLLMLTYAIRHEFLGVYKMPATIRYAGVGFLGFIWLNTTILRAVHHYADVAYQAIPLWNSIVVQMSLSILWTLCALMMMNIARRTQAREFWMVGAGLLGVVLLKLFTRDLTGSGTLARIISFMVVGALMLLIGYLSPIPKGPNSTTSQTENDRS